MTREEQQRELLTLADEVYRRLANPPHVIAAFGFVDTRRLRAEMRQRLHLMARYARIVMKKQEKING
jgi:hypothetical protein